MKTGGKGARERRAERRAALALDASVTTRELMSSETAKRDVKRTRMLALVARDSTGRRSAWAMSPYEPRKGWH